MYDKDETTSRTETNNNEKQASELLMWLGTSIFVHVAIFLYIPAMELLFCIHWFWIHILFSVNAHTAHIQHAYELKPEYS